MHLNMLRGAVAAYGGNVEVVGVEQAGSLVGRAELGRFACARPVQRVCQGLRRSAAVCGTMYEGALLWRVLGLIAPWL